MRKMRPDICLRKIVSSHGPGKKAKRGDGGGGGGGNWEEGTHGPNLATSTPFQTEIVDFPYRIEYLSEKIDTPYHSSKTDMTEAIPYRNVSYRIVLYIASSWVNT